MTVLTDRETDRTKKQLISCLLLKLVLVRSTFFHPCEKSKTLGEKIVF